MSPIPTPLPADYDLCAFQAWPEALRAMALPTLSPPLTRAMAEEIMQPGISTRDAANTSIGVLLRGMDWAGGRFVKLSWSAPTDCEGLVASLACHSPEQALALLKMSDKVCHDILDPYYTGDNDISRLGRGEEARSPLHLVVRDYLPLDPQYEVRVVLLDGVPVAAFPRHEVTPPDHTKAILRCLKKIIPALPLREGRHLSALALDIALDPPGGMEGRLSATSSEGKRRAARHMSGLGFAVLDVAPLRSESGLPLVSEEELESIVEERGEFRFILPDAERLGRYPKVLMANHFPIELTSQMIQGTFPEVIAEIRRHCGPRGGEKGGEDE